MNFTAKDVAALREKTGCGMMDCKKALTEAEGNMDKAIDLLREKGLAASVKKAGRIAAEGVAFATVSDCGKVAVVIEVNAETDFVAKNAEFQAFVKTCADTVMAQNPADVDALLQCKAEGSDLTVDALLKEKILVIGENIKIRRFARYEGVVTSYVHAGGRIGVIVKFDTTDDIAATDAFKTYAHNVAMQIAAMNAEYLDEASVPAERVEKEKAILTQQIVDEGKPQNIAEKIVAGRLNKFFKEICLVDQVYVQDSSMTVKQYTESVAKELGGDIKIAAYTRFEKGEGLEKRDDSNYAAEIAIILLACAAFSKTGDKLELPKTAGRNSGGSTPKTNSSPHSPRTPPASGPAPGPRAAGSAGPGTPGKGRGRQTPPRTR